VAKKSSQTSLFGPRSIPGLTPQRKVGSPGPQQIETKGREDALDKLEEYRSGLVEIGRDVAIALAKRRNRITSVEVFAELRAQGYDAALDAVDPRWMGVVFREDIWQREGWETTGSHRRPVAVWSLRDPHNVPLSPREKVYRAVSAQKDNGATVEEIVIATALTGSQVRTALKDLQTLSKVSSTTMRRRGKSRRKTTVYALPEHDPDIL
jgi:hypothetical protein